MALFSKYKELVVAAHGDNNNGLKIKLS